MRNEERGDAVTLEHARMSTIYSYIVTTKDWICAHAVLIGYVLSSEKRDEYVTYAKKCNDYLRKVYDYYVILWKDKQKSKQMLGDLFTYGSFAALVLTSVGMALSFDVRARAIIQTFGAVFTIGSTALKVNSGSSFAKSLNGVRERVIDMGESVGIPIGIAGQIRTVSSVLGVLMAFLVGALGVRLRARKIHAHE